MFFRKNIFFYIIIDNDLKSYIKKKLNEFNSL